MSRDPYAGLPAGFALDLQTYHAQLAARISEQGTPVTPLQVAEVDAARRTSSLPPHGSVGRVIENALRGAEGQHHA